MTYGLLADLIVAIHFAFVIFVVLGGLLALRWRWIPWLHLPAAGWGVFIEATGRVCPLTPLENRLRIAAGGSAYEGDFLAQYLGPILYPPILTREVQLALGALVIVINAAIYIVVWRRRARVEKHQRANPLV